MAGAVAATSLVATTMNFEQKKSKDA